MQVFNKPTYYFIAHGYNTNNGAFSAIIFFQKLKELYRTKWIQTHNNII